MDESLGHFLVLSMEIASRCVVNTSIPHYYLRYCKLMSFDYRLLIALDFPILRILSMVSLPFLWIWPMRTAAMPCTDESTKPNKLSDGMQQQLQMVHSLLVSLLTYCKLFKSFLSFKMH